jgi:ureidoglycolate hydrolase
VKIKIQGLTRELFSPWGQFVPADCRSGMTQLSIANYAGNLAVAEVGEKASLSLLKPFNREFTLKCMEQHNKTHEICVAVQGDCVITVTRDLNGEPDSDNLEAFLLKQGDTVVYAPGVWHWVPFPAGTGESGQLIIYKDQTGANDFIKKELPRALELEI